MEFFEMNSKLSTEQLKAISRGQLLGRYGFAISAELAAAGIMLAVHLICFLPVDQSTTAGLVLAFFISCILDVLSGVFAAGLTRFYLNLVCNRPGSVKDIFYNFRVHTNKALAIRLLTSIPQVIGCLPFLASGILIADQENPSAGLYLLYSAAMLVALIVYISVWLLYSQAYYLLLDFPGYSTRQIMSVSRRMMKGHKGRLFYLTVSLIPYYLLCFLSCSIASLWVTPFSRVLFTNFYLDLIHRNHAA